MTRRPLIAQDAQYRALWLVVGGLIPVILLQGAFESADWLYALYRKQPFNVGDQLRWWMMPPLSLIAISVIPIVLWRREEERTRREVRESALLLLGVWLAMAVEATILARFVHPSQLIELILPTVLGAIGVKIVFSHARRLPS